MPTHLHLYNQSTECRETVLPPAELKKTLWCKKKSVLCREICLHAYKSLLW